MGDVFCDGNDLNSLILQSLNGSRIAAARLAKPARRYALALVKARAPDLPWDVQEEAAQEGFANLLAAKSSDYDEARGSPRQFFRLLLRNAIRTVRISYTPPGQPTRQRRRQPEPPAPTAAPKFATAASTALDDAAALPDLAAEARILAVEARIDVARLLAIAPPLAATGLRLVHLQDLPVHVAAAQLGMSRFALRQEIKRFAPAWKAAA